MENRKIKVLLVDDCLAMAVALSALLSQNHHLQVVGLAQHGRQALEFAETMSPDVIVTDLEMPVMNGAEFVVRQMSERAIPILVFSGLELDDPLAAKAMAAGAVDFLRKPARSEEVSVQQELLQSKIMEAGRQLSPNSIL
mgnify:CR=1 FL=1